MRKSISITFALFILTATNVEAQIFNDLKEKVEEKVTTTSSSLTEEEVGAGLKEALTNGVEKGVAQLSKPDGYFKDPAIKIPLPEEARNAEDKLRRIGQGKKVDDAIESINRAAEDAASAHRTCCGAPASGGRPGRCSGGAGGTASARDARACGAQCGTGS